MQIGLKSISYYLPGEKIDVHAHYNYFEPILEVMNKDERIKLLETIPDFVHRFKDISALEHMALSAAEKTLDSSGLAPSEIDGLIVAQTGGKQFMPLIASYLQLNLGLNKNTIARNVNDNNISILSVMKLARIYIQSGKCTNVLIVASSAQIGGKYGFGADLTDPMCMYLGDGAAAAIVSKENIECEILSEYMETYPVASRKTGTLNGDYGTVRPPVNKELCFAAEMDDKYGAYLENGNIAFNEMVGKKGFLPMILKRGAKNASLDIGKIDHIISSHTGPFLDSWNKDLCDYGIKSEVIINKQKTIGDTGVADVLIDLAYFAKTEKFKPDDIIALIAVSKSVQVAIVFLQWL